MSSKISLLLTGLLIGAFTMSQAHALPIDWNGQFGYDTNLIKNVRRTTDECAAADGYCTGNDEDNARYQSYIFKLRPTIVVNDSATVKGELSTGSVRGGIAGEDATGRNSYFAQSPDGSSTITLNQLYAELYGDTAMVKVGKFAKNFGLGAVVSEGSDIWDRYFSVYNGFELRFDLGKFSVAPTFAKISSPALSQGPQNGSQDASETGITASYNDPTNNFEFAVYYALRSVETESELYDTDGTAGTSNTTSSDVTLIDVFFSKRWDKFKIAMEIPMLSGEVGNIYGGADQDLDTNAYILETSYDLNERWTVGFNGGMVKGEDGQDDFTALYLHPNYKIAELMFAYNYAGFQGAGDIFNGSVTNANFAKLYANYESEAWRWYLGLVMAMANETASEGDTYFNQDSNTFDTAASDQSDELGMELDIVFDYKWNPNVTVSGYLAYWQVGDFYAFDNSGEDLETSDVTATGLKVSLDF